MQVAQIKYSYIEIIETEIETNWIITQRETLASSHCRKISFTLSFRYYLDDLGLGIGTTGLPLFIDLNLAKMADQCNDSKSNPYK